MFSWRIPLALAACSMLAGCTTQGEIIPPPLPPKQAWTKATATFETAQAEMRELDATQQWTVANCRKNAARFREVAESLQAARKPERIPFARYNEAVAYQRCNLVSEATAIHRELLASDPSFYRSRVQLALVAFRDGGNLDDAIAELSRAVADGRFQSPEALVQLSALQMQRHNSVADDDGSDDFDRANKNLRRALAHDDSYMPAYNQLAVLLLEQAKRKAGRDNEGLTLAGHERPKADTQALELAALVCSQAMRKRGDYAPVHNTAGLISAELGNLSEAARAFGKARELDAGFFEAHMNYAAVNMQFRGFERARDAYEAALRIQPKSYEARLGLALALRGQVRGAESDKLVAQSFAELGKAKELDPSRAEAYFNEAILVQEFRARGEGAEALKGLRSARGLFEAFLSRAKDDPDMKRASDRARERMSDIDQIIAVLEGK